MTLYPFSCQFPNEHLLCNFIKKYVLSVSAVVSFGFRLPHEKPALKQQTGYQDARVDVPMGGYAVIARFKAREGGVAGDQMTPTIALLPF